MGKGTNFSDLQDLHRRINGMITSEANLLVELRRFGSLMPNEGKYGKVHYISDDQLRAFLIRVAEYVKGSRSIYESFIESPRLVAALGEAAQLDESLQQGIPISVFKDKLEKFARAH